MSIFKVIGQYVYVERNKYKFLRPSNLTITIYFILKVLDQIQKIVPTLHKSEILYQKKDHTDYRSDIWGPKYVSFRCYEQKSA